MRWRLVGESRDATGSLAYRGAVVRDSGTTGNRLAARFDEDAARLRLEADGRDDAADERDASADESDRAADARDAHADVRDAAVSDQPDIGGTRHFAAQDRDASADDRTAAADNRVRAREDRKASSWDRSAAELIRVKLIDELNDADTLPDTTLVLGQAQGMLMATFGGNAAEAMIEIGDQADRDQVGLQEAARRILADGAPSGISSIRVPEL